MTDEERGHSNKLVYQYLPSRYGMNPNDLRRADAIEIVVGDRGNLRYVNLQDWSQKVWHFAHQKAVIGQDSNLQWTVGALGARLAKVNQHVSLRGKRGTCQAVASPRSRRAKHSLRA